MTPKSQVGWTPAGASKATSPMFGLPNSGPAQGQQLQLKQTSDVTSLLRLCCRASVYHSGNIALDVASRVPRDEGESCCCLLLELSYKSMICNRVAFTKTMMGIMKTPKTTKTFPTARNKKVECWIRGNHGNDGNDENHWILGIWSANHGFEKTGVEMRLKTIGTEKITYLSFLVGINLGHFDVNIAYLNCFRNLLI